MDGELKVLQSMVDEEAHRDVELFMVFHVLPDTEYFLEYVTDIFAVDRIIGVPYTSEVDVAERIAEKYEIEITIPDSVEHVEAEAKAYLETYAERKPDRDLVVLDIGGNCAPFIDAIDTEPIVGIIEDTNQGHWRYERASLPVPVYSIAQARLKAPENRTVGEAITFSVENIVRNQFEQELNGKRVLVLGYGNIGQSVAAACCGRGADVMVYDTDSIKNISARLEGYSVTSRESMLESAQIIIGATGQRSITREDFSQLSGTTILASGTSKQVEIDVDGLDDVATLVDESALWKRFELDGNSIVLLNDGFPVNFLDNSVSLAILDLIYCGIYGGIQWLLTDERECRIHQPSERLTQTVASSWLEEY